MRRPAARWILVACVAALLAAGVVVAVTRDTGSTSSASNEPIGGAGFVARTDGERKLVLGFTGGSPTLDPSDPCWQGYRAEATETDDRVTVSIRVLRSSTPFPPNYACTLEAYARTTEVTLKRPLGTRVLVDGSTGAEQRPFDGTTLLRPRTLPAGWDLRRDGPPVAVPGALSWSRTWGPPPEPPRNGTCAETVTPVTLTQSMDAPSGLQRVEPVTVRGVAGTVERDTLQIRVRWEERGQFMLLDGAPPCVTTPAATLPFLLDFARSLE
jgi:hypothetical protein